MARFDQGANHYDEWYETKMGYEMDVYDLIFKNEVFNGAFSMAAFEFIEKREIAFTPIESENYILNICGCD